MKITAKKLSDIVREEMAKEGIVTRRDPEDLGSAIVTSGDALPQKQEYLEARIMDAIHLLKQGHSEEALEELMNALTIKL